MKTLLWITQMNHKSVLERTYLWLISWNDNYFCNMFVLVACIFCTVVLKCLPGLFRANWDNIMPSDHSMPGILRAPAGSSCQWFINNTSLWWITIFNARYSISIFSLVLWYLNRFKIAVDAVCLSRWKGNFHIQIEYPDRFIGQLEFCGCNYH